MTLSLERDGAELLAGAILDALDRLETLVRNLDVRAGQRLNQLPGLSDLLAPQGAVGRHVAKRLGPEAKPVRALLFDKTADNNWGLAWHQDRTIAVRERIEVAGFGPWTIKSGMPHVAPPIEILARMITVRVHLDPVPVDNAPLLIAPGSHRLGIVAEAKIDKAVKRCGTVACLAQPADLWLYSTPILHASPSARKPLRRRVLQVDYAVLGLPGGLQWLGI